MYRERMHTGCYPSTNTWGRVFGIPLSNLISLHKKTVDVPCSARSFHPIYGVSRMTGDPSHPAPQRRAPIYGVSRMTGVSPAASSNIWSISHDWGSQETQQREERRREEEEGRAGEGRGEEDSELRIRDSELRTQNSGLRTQNLGFRTQDSGLRT